MVVIGLIDEKIRYLFLVDCCIGFCCVRCGCLEYVVFINGGFVRFCVDGWVYGVCGYCFFCVCDLNGG